MLQQRWSCCSNCSSSFFPRTKTIVYTNVKHEGGGENLDTIFVAATLILLQQSWSCCSNVDLVAATFRHFVPYHIFIYIYAQTYICTDHISLIYICRCRCMDVYMYMYAGHARVYIHTYIYIYTYIYAHVWNSIFLHRSMKECRKAVLLHRFRKWLYPWNFFAWILRLCAKLIHYHQ